MKKKTVEEASQVFGLNNWKNCVAISGDGKAVGEPEGKKDLGLGEMGSLVIIMLSACLPHRIKRDDSCVIYHPNRPYSF